MANYPSFPQLVGTVVEGLGGQELRRTISGKPRIRRYYSATRYDVTIVHDLSDADVATLVSFYNTNKDIAFNFTYEQDDQVYSCYFVEYPDIQPIGAGYSKVTVTAVVA